MYANDITKITPPATLADLAALDLAALDVTREIPYLKARCNRMGIHIPAPNPTPLEIIPHIERRLAEHDKRRGMFLSDCSEWKAIKEDLEQFISYLKTLTPSFSSFSSVQSSEPKSNHPEPKPAQTRTDPEPKADRSRNDPESPNEKSAKTLQNHHATTKKAKNTSDQPSAPAPIDLKNLSFDQLAELAIEKGLLPNPKHCRREEYADAFMDLVGIPPTRILLEDINSHFQSHILGLLEKKSLKAVCDQLLLPPPFGLYILTSKSSLRRFRLRHHARETEEKRITLRQEIERALTQPDLTDTDFMRATEQLLKLRLVESSLHPDPDLAQTKTLIDMLEKIRAGKLAERKIALAESKK